MNDSAGQAPRPQRWQRAGFGHFEAMPVRWMDCDMYGHVNNVVYYAYFDTAVNRYLASAGQLDPQAGAVIGLVVETHCNFHAPAEFPETLQIGLRVAHVGRSSVRYELGVFRPGDELCAAQGHFVHVYVDRASRRPVALPAGLRACLGRLAAAGRA
ncbi:acyl-CoA thioesterase [Bordetella bronchiseptica]|uniref:4-hydroxybenzoyl-CoA thioesterase n=2 Tax=Bordetella bronchiseptica TaxID=518 RepID=A0A0H3LN22_BORBR|nr:thioesterase family protein [Bordetella bronchiseptica]KAK69348.1 acyl-CoA thioester hydrolase, YbgC/YbaW family [Bordetella bronchiseptica 980-2]AMG88988.1 acyl-CoA thioesterase [Bordetella bronchiseptica]KCV47103.1 acyl-CoA thioester hydrolase, YbgC/YbaW family [Bordetella bronchiseptica 3E44]KCV56632.1 acyl-CoA thioester hydrolase, YbgC/YbaW family [Bordetella bronchiseptica 980]KDB88755.1 acyl-CoA thioester hydrolase, YbgC/YbaW family [Bordetella bronchiseptica D989]